MANNPYVNKVQYGNTTLIDLTADTVTADKLMEGYTAHDRTGALITGTATGGSGSGAVWQDAQGYVHLSDEGDIELQTKTVSPTESAQTVTADAGYYALDKVNVGAISSSYVGSSITRRSSSDLTASGATVTVPSGYYSAQASKTVSSGSAGTPTATKGSVSNHAISVTPSVTNTTGYITGGTKTGTAVSVSASELVSGNLPITENGNNINVANYATVSVDVSSSGGSSYVLHSSNLEITANVTSTSATILSESLRCDSSAINESTMIFVKIRDKAGKRNGYFYGSDTIFTCVGSGTTGWAQSYRSTRVYRYNDNHVYTHTLGTTTGYGVYVSSIDGTGALTVQGRYSSSYSLTINGTYSIEVYTLEWPNNEPPYNNDATG